MDYQIATVVLKDGRRFPRTVIQGSYYVTSVGDDAEIPFAESDIGSIIVDHGKKQSMFFYLRLATRRFIAKMNSSGSDGSGLG